MQYKSLSALILASLLTAATLADAQAGPIRDRIRERMQERMAERGGDSTDADSNDPNGLGGNAQNCAEWEAKVSRLQRIAANRHPGPAPSLKDIAYGNSALEKLDVYYPGGKPAGPAPVIVMVHGGGWCVGDKAVAGVTENKVGRWVPRGFLFVSLNYPMVSEGSDALAQANHVARAVAYVQAHAGEWGGDPGRVILMGHSAGAHLVSLVNADAHIRQANGVRPVLGTVSLDAGAVDVVRQMPNTYNFLKARYREAFGETEQQWIAAYP